MKSHKLFWDKVAVKYDHSTLKTYTEAYEKTIELSKDFLNKDDIMLDYGCGTGITTTELAECVKQVKAIDISSEMIVEASKKTEFKGITNVDFQIGDIFSLNDKENSYNIITAFNILYFLENPGDSVKKIYKLLKPGGIFLSVTDCIREKPGLKSIFLKGLMKIHVLPVFRMFTVKQLEALIYSSNFKIIKQENLFENPPNTFIAAIK